MRRKMDPCATLPRLLADQLRAHLSEDVVARRPAEAPASDKPATDKPAAAPAARCGNRRAEIRQTQTGSDGHRRCCSRSPRHPMASIIFWSDGSMVSTDDAYVRANNTMLGARVSGHIAAILPGDNSWSAGGDVDLQDRRRRLSHRGRCRAHQDRDPAGHHRPHRPPGHRAGKRGRAGQGAARFRGGRPEARRPRLTTGSRR